jgi:hypothetical protein
MRVAVVAPGHYAEDSGAERIRRVVAMTPAAIHAAAAVFAPPPSAPGTPCYCVSIARIHVVGGMGLISWVFGPDDS